MLHRTVLAALLLLLSPALRAASYDLIIRNARIIDGTGAPWYRGEIAVAGDTIVRIDRRIEGTASRELDAQDRIVAPGFIDLHTHARRGIFEVPTADNYIRQGVTTIFEGRMAARPSPSASFSTVSKS